MEAIKKIWAFLRSMKFGIALLLIIAALSVVGTIIPQGEPLGWYAEKYPSAFGTILGLGLNQLYQSWYYVALLALLSLNLALCTISRLRMLLRTEKDETVRAARLPIVQQLDGEQVELVRGYLKEHHCREREVEGVTMYTKNHFGRYGTFLTHLGILLTVVFGAAALYLPTVQDLACLPGESLVLEDGTEIAVQDFSLQDEDGKLDYASNISVKLPNGSQSDVERISVNHPMVYGPYKIYQQQYGVAGSITVIDNASGTEDTFQLTEEAVLTKDGMNGLLYQGIATFSDTEEGGLATYRPETGQSPVYIVQTIEMGVPQARYALPGFILDVGDLSYVINDPVTYPGLRIKHTPRIVNAMLIVAFAVMTVGLYITFFLQPVLVKLTNEGVTVAGTKPEGMRSELEQLLEDAAEQKRGKEKKKR